MNSYKNFFKITTSSRSRVIVYVRFIRVGIRCVFVYAADE